MYNDIRQPTQDKRRTESIQGRRRSGPGPFFDQLADPPIVGFGYGHAQSASYPSGLLTSRRYQSVILVGKKLRGRWNCSRANNIAQIEKHLAITAIQVRLLRWIIPKRAVSPR